MKERQCKEAAHPLQLIKAALFAAAIICMMLCAGCGTEGDAAAVAQVIKSQGFVIVPDSLDLDYVYLFSEPDAGSPVVASIQRDTAIEIYDVRGQWYYAGQDDKRGFISAEYVTLVPPEDRRVNYTDLTTETTTETEEVRTTVTTTTTTEPVTETEPPETEAPETDAPEETTVAVEEVTTPADTIPGVPPVNVRPAPFFSEIYIFNSAPENADGQCFTLHAAGTYDYWVADIFVHSTDSTRSLAFTARGSDLDTALAAGSCYDYVTVTIVPYYNDGAKGNTTTVRYDIIRT